MVVRELCGDVYFGKPAGIYTDDAGVRWGQNNMIYSEPEIERIARVAMDVAQKRQGRCCSIDKANVLDVSQLWKDVVIRVHGECGQGVELSHMYVDNAAMQFVRWPKQFDTIVCGNIFGDILSTRRRCSWEAWACCRPLLPLGGSRRLRAHPRLGARHRGHGRGEPAGHDS